MIRKMDELGRIVIPIDIRERLHWKEKEDLEIIEHKDSIILILQL